MSKSLPVYDLSQWIKSDRNIGYVVARMSDWAWDVRPDYASRKDVERFMGRGAGYVIQWVDLEHNMITLANGLPERNDVIASYPRRLSWLRAETIAEKRYQPCENPVKTPIKYEPFDPPSDDVNDGVTAIAFDADGKDHVVPEPSQPVLPLDIEALNETMARSAVALGKIGADWLRAKGLTL